MPKRRFFSEKLDETFAEIEQAGREAMAAIADITSRAAVDAMVADIVEHFGRLDRACRQSGDHGQTFAGEGKSRHVVATESVPRA